MSATRGIDATADHPDLDATAPSSTVRSGRAPSATIRSLGTGTSEYKSCFSQAVRAAGLKCQVTTVPARRMQSPTRNSSTKTVPTSPQKEARLASARKLVATKGAEFFRQEATARKRESQQAAHAYRAITARVEGLVATRDRARQQSPPIWPRPRPTKLRRTVALADR